MEQIISLGYSKDDRISQVFKKEIIFEQVLKKAKILNKKHTFDRKIWTEFGKVLTKMLGLL